MEASVEKKTILKSVITYLEMNEKPVSVPPVSPARPLAMLRAKKPTISFYRYLYNNIGADWLWWERRAWSDEVLRDVISSDNLEIYVLYIEGVPAGYGELDFRETNEVELSYFGLLPEFIGQGLGGFFLRWLIDQAWRNKVRRLHVHTCTEDHPSALYLYQKHGFKPYRQLSVEIDHPKNSGLFN